MLTNATARRGFLAIALTMCLTQNVDAQVIRRLVWSYEGGFFEDNGMARWVEKNSTGTYNFKEVGRNNDFIELFDQSRNVSCRLYSNAMYLKGFQGFTDFGKYYDGRWTR